MPYAETQYAAGPGGESLGAIHVKAVYASR